MYINKIQYINSSKTFLYTSNNLKNICFKANYAQTDNFGTDKTERSNLFVRLKNGFQKGIDYTQKAFNKVYYKILPDSQNVSNTKSTKQVSEPKPKSQIEFPKPNFSFDFKRLKTTLTNTPKITPDWICENQADFENIIRTIPNVSQLPNASIKSLNEFNEKFDSKEMQAVVINAIIAKPNFLNIAEKQYTAERKAYVDSIMPYLYKKDKQLKIKAIEAIEKYGTREHGDKLGLFLGKRDEEIIVPVVRAIAATGKPDDALLITGYIRNPENIYSPDTFKEILSCAAKLADIKGWAKQDQDILLAPIRRLCKSENSEVAKAANDALDIILNKC